MQRKIYLNVLAVITILFAGAMAKAAVFADANAEDVALDEKVFAFLHHMNGAESQWAALALEQTQNQDVRNLASAELANHQQIDKDLAGIAAKGNIKVRDLDPTNHDESDVFYSDRDNLNKLNSYSGTDFDKNYVDVVISNHVWAVKTFSDFKAQLKDADHVQFVSDVITKLQADLKTAQDLQTKIGKP